MTAIIPAKAITRAEQSDSIVVSFGVEWRQHLLAKGFSIVIRRRVPKLSSFKWLYVHINRPLSAICARAPITEIFKATPNEAVALAKQINLTPAEIRSYFGRRTSIGCYRLGPFEFSSEPVSAAKLATRLVYNPPQSFFIVSKKAKVVIDQFAGFNTSRNAHSHEESSL